MKNILVLLIALLSSMTTSAQHGKGLSSRIVSGDPCHCYCDLQSVFNNGNSASYDGSNIGNMRLFQDNLHVNNYSVYEYSGVSTWYDNAGAPIKIADFGHDPAGIPGNGYMHLFTTVGDTAILCDAVSQQIIIKNQASSVTTTIAPTTAPASALRIQNSWPREDGPIAVNPVVADTQIFSRSVAGPTLSFTVPTGVYPTYLYIVTAYTDILTTTPGTYMNMNITYIDETSLPQTQLLVPNYSALGVQLSNTRTIWASAGTTITINTGIVGAGTISYNCRMSITKAYK